MHDKLSVHFRVVSLYYAGYSPAKQQKCLNIKACLSSFQPHFGAALYRPLGKILYMLPTVQTVHNICTLDATKTLDVTIMGIKGNLQYFTQL